MKRTITASLTAAALLVAGCSAFQNEPGTRMGERTAPLFSDLGDHHHSITTDSKTTQKYFDQGLTLCYGFNHAEAIRSFRAAIDHDADCAMCYWGVAYALGPNINAPMSEGAVPQAWEAVEQAQAHASHVSEREQAYIAALSKRYAPEAREDRSDLDRVYADAMREVARDYPDDLDAATLFAEALMDTMPWDYYREDGTQKPATEEVVTTLQTVLAKAPNHAGAIHFYIHAVEASSTPERAEAPADRLGALVPGAGHLVHMPSHIYYRIGRYADATTVNERAAAADESYIAQCKAQGFYPALYYPHNVHFLYAAASEEGRSSAAIEAAHKLIETTPDSMFAEYPMLEEFRPVYLFALARFGRFDEILAQPMPSQELRYTTAMSHYARGVAFAARGDLEEAEGELDRLRASLTAFEENDLALLSGSSASQLLAIANHVLSARVARARGQRGQEIAELSEAVTRQDSLPYSEPPPWYFPVRQALGAALLRASRYDEAVRVFREDLARNPNNGWSLYGLARSLRAQGLEHDAVPVEASLATAWVRADIEPRLSYP